MLLWHLCSTIDTGSRTIRAKLSVWTEKACVTLGMNSRQLWGTIPSETLGACVKNPNPTIPHAQGWRNHSKFRRNELKSVILKTVLRCLALFFKPKALKVLTLLMWVARSHGRRHDVISYALLFSFLNCFILLSPIFWHSTSVFTHRISLTFPRPAESALFSF